MRFVSATGSRKSHSCHHEPGPGLVTCVVSAHVLVEVAVSAWGPDLQQVCPGQAAGQVGISYPDAGGTSPYTTWAMVTKSLNVVLNSSGQCVSHSWANACVALGKVTASVRPTA